MSPADVVLLGYYGRGNLGDDLLMIVAHALARQILPDARIAIRTGTPATYFDRLLGQSVERLPFGTRDRHRLILHGGGGTFFDFAGHSGLRRATNAMLLPGGAATLVRAEAALRRLTGRPRMSARTRFGLGIGIGTFAPGSPKLRDALPVLADFDALWLRDPESVTNLDRLGVAPPVVSGSDLAFLWEHWCPPELALAPRSIGPGRPAVGVILRDWPTGSSASFARQIGPSLDHLATCYDLTLISFDSSADAGTLARLPTLSHATWDPEETSVADFSRVLAAQDVLLTARAHGAVCGACLGRASVLLEIEPKLRAIHGMLPETTRLAAMPFDPPTIVELVEEALAIPANRIAADALRNNAESRHALAQIMERITP